MCFIISNLTCINVIFYFKLGNPINCFNSNSYKNYLLSLQPQRSAGNLTSLILQDKIFFWFCLLNLFKVFFIQSNKNIKSSYQQQGSVCQEGWQTIGTWEWMRSDGWNNFLVWHDSRRDNFQRKFQTNIPRDSKHVDTALLIRNKKGREREKERINREKIQSWQCYQKQHIVQMLCIRKYPPNC